MLTLTGLKFEIELAFWLGLATLGASIIYMLRKSRDLLPKTEDEPEEQING